MKLIEPTQKPVKKDSFQKILDQINRHIPFGQTDENAEDAIIARFTRGLDNRFIMLHNLQLGTGQEVFPPVLIGPPGMVLLNVSLAKGFFRAREDSWWEMSKSSHRFGPGRPDLIKQSRDYAQKLADILDARGKSHPEIIPVLLFANPGVHVETTNPAIRIVLMDGVENLIANLRKNEEVLPTNEINLLADALEVMANPEKAIPIGEGEDFFGRDLLLSEEKTPRKLPKVPIPNDLSLPPVEEKLKFTQKQWIILAVLLILTILVLLGAIIFALNYLHP
jgi:hypothetical protein